MENPSEHHVVSLGKESSKGSKVNWDSWWSLNENANLVSLQFPSVGSVAISIFLVPEGGKTQSACVIPSPSVECSQPRVWSTAGDSPLLSASGQ